MALVEMRGLKVRFRQHDGWVEAVRDSNLQVEPGESLGIVGESGSGKSVTCMALMRLLPSTAQVEAESLRIDGVDMLAADRRTLSRLRGSTAAMIFQDPMSAFDPVFTIGQQIVETIRTHRRASKAEAMAEAEKLLARVEIKNPRDVLSYYPHQLSGGMLQRAMIALALSCRPKVLIADEPTTALDVTVQAQILQLIKKLQAEFGMALIMITHDLGVIAETVDRVAVMYGGRVLETGSVEDIFDRPQHDYTKSLLASLRAGENRTEQPEQTSDEAPALELRGLSKIYPVRRRKGLARQTSDFYAVRRVDLVLPRNKIIGLVGESGSGKSTTGMMAMRLLEPSSGRVLVNGVDITELDPLALKVHRKHMQVVFQDSYSALNPMMTLTQIITEPLDIHRTMPAAQQKQLAVQWLERVGLDRSFANRYPHELSGGQRQRVAIARALILEPSVLVADEPTSALDVSVKAQVIALLKSLQEQMGLSMLFISHDLSVVRSFTDSVVVMLGGRIVEQGPTASIFANPRHPYTRSLLDAAPVTSPHLRRERTFLSAAEIASAVPRFVLADLAAPAEASDIPQLVTIAPGHMVEAVVPA
ncbi:ABC transporter ATP-binding protein [Devosia faecipullorum]|uniref:ABC transporter ATP-binding protein n=1 Tax=Devosia faecipullorum TaxID=2755039 RepID=UPI00187B3720|nr:ABC transporter ATP-binding protein [Devosia faecipullorum]MBE7734591.1 ABC transporter ATP-binding protein [Devosia faecipullorum]